MSKSKATNRKSGAAVRSSELVGRLTRSAAKQMLGETGVVVTIAGKDFLCEKHDDTFRTLKGMVRLKAGDVVTHNGKPLLVTEHMEDAHFITFETQQQPPNSVNKRRSLRFIRSLELTFPFALLPDLINGDSRLAVDHRSLLSKRQGRTLRTSRCIWHP